MPRIYKTWDYISSNGILLIMTEQKNGDRDIKAEVFQTLECGLKSDTIRQIKMPIHRTGRIRT